MKAATGNSIIVKLAIMIEMPVGLHWKNVTQIGVIIVSNTPTLKNRVKIVSAQIALIRRRSQLRIPRTTSSRSKDGRSVSGKTSVAAIDAISVIAISRVLSPPLQALPSLSFSSRLFSSEAGFAPRLCTDSARLRAPLWRASVAAAASSGVVSDASSWLSCFPRLFFILGNVTALGSSSNARARTSRNKVKMVSTRPGEFKVSMISVDPCFTETKLQRILKAGPMQIPSIFSRLKLHNINVRRLRIPSVTSTM
mmetsp:Transcript_4552/g.17910  ORF Transcript_4552/g.17910 Transcript_4552/m.17910 type:complete len:253 (+) Transcript_4552:670-1428(+)